MFEFFSPFSARLQKAATNRFIKLEFGVIDFSRHLVPKVVPGGAGRSFLREIGSLHFIAVRLFLYD